MIYYREIPFELFNKTTKQKNCKSVINENIAKNTYNDYHYDHNVYEG